MLEARVTERKGEAGGAEGAAAMKQLDCYKAAGAITSDRGAGGPRVRVL